MPAVAEETEAGRSGRRTASRALELLDERIADDLSLERVAGELRVSPSHLSRVLARHAGMGFADCLARLRVERAKAFLASGSVAVKEAAAAVGFRDPAYFARVFRRFEGLSPADYRDGFRAAGEPGQGEGKEGGG
jgi:two-component system response regulator YesN